MPNFFSAFTSDVFRPLVTLLIPGAIAISTWFVALLWKFGDLRKLAYGNHTETGLVLFLAMTFAGLALEDLGTHVETCLDKRKGKKHIDDWNAYLRTAFVVEPIGRRYIRTLVLRLKFELGAGLAMLFAGAGVFYLWYEVLDSRTAVVSILICAIFALWLIAEACSTHGILADNRTNLLGEIRIISASQTNSRS